MGKLAVSLFAAILLSSPALAAARIKALIVDGQNNHRWQVTTPILKKYLEETGLFTVDVATSPAKGADMSGFQPNFSAYKVVVSNYNDFRGDPWPQKTIDALVAYVRGGGGFVSYHAADNAFGFHKEFNELIALGGWAGQEKWGPHVVWKDGKLVPNEKAGRAGHHGPQHAYQIVMRDLKHPIARGLPEKWLHSQDELYDTMRGPANIDRVVGTGFSAPEQKGTGFDEPLLFTVRHGKGRVFHTMLGHDIPALECVGFIVTFQRGVEWAATGKVSQKAPADFPTASESKVRKLPQ
jgi:type 1 glutamine amidotransferase